jgi:hypothetical protein
MAFERRQAAIEIDYSLNGNEHLMERLSNNNPWAEKLEQVSLPDAGEAWKAMAVVLDKEMPADQRKRRRRWLLLILLLPLLGGPGYFLWQGQNAGKAIISAPAGKSTVSAPGVAAVVAPAPLVAGHPVAVCSRRAANRHRVSVSSGADVATVTGVVVKDDEVAHQRPIKHSDPGGIMPLGITGPNLSGIRVPHSNDPLKCPPVEREKTTGFVVGIGLNQALPVQGQQVWTNPSGGLNTWWKDYIPVPFVQYYLQPKVFVQAEVRIHAPQYTPGNLWFSYLSNGGAYSGQVYIKKLFYFQLPVTIHYAPSPRWSIGLGLQYSLYDKGIAATPDTNQRNYYFTAPLSAYPMVYVQHNEFRGLVSLDYIYRRWVVGTSYDEAFTRAVSVRIANLPGPPGSTFLNLPPPVRNNSLQLYVRYILWDGRGKEPLPAK